MDIIQTVFNSLERDTLELQRTVADRAEIDTELSDGRYSDEYKKELSTRRDELTRKIERDSDAAIRKAKALAAQYREEAEAMVNLDPAQITDDIKLLQAGIMLKERDIRAILKRSENNPTMTQMALRYAEEHNIQIDRSGYIGNAAELETANTVDERIHYYAHWIDKPNAVDMLHKFFCV